MDFAAQFDDLRQLSGEELAERASRVLPPWISLGLVVVLAWQLAGLTWFIVPSSEPGGLPTALSGTPVRHGGQSYNVERIVDAHIFDDAAMEPVVNDVPQEQVAETKLNLELTGLVRSDDLSQYAFAIISAGGEEKAYWVGDALPGQGTPTMSAIRNDNVLIERAGGYEQLTMKETESTRTARSSLPSATPSSLRQLRNELTRNPASFTDIVRPQQVFQNGQLVGYRVYPGRERQKFVELGLKPGDLVTAINGQTLDDATRSAQVFRDLATATQIDVTVERNGQPEVVSIQLDQ